MKQCSVDGCTNNCSAKGFCRKHYARYKRHGSPHVVNKRGNKKLSEVCVVCGEQSVRSGLCSKHLGEYNQERQTYKILQQHSKDMNTDPESLSDEFVENLVFHFLDERKEDKHSEAIE